MAQPTQSTLHLDAPLSNLSIAHMQAPNNFIASKAAPMLNVDKQSNKYFVFDKASFFRDSMRKRGPGEESAGSGYTLSSDSYYCDVWALHKDISDFDRANTDSPLNADANAVSFLTQQALIRLEAQFVTDCVGTGIWGTDNTPSNLWSDYVNSDPIANIDTAKETILTNTGQEANTLVLGLKVFNQLKNHPDIVDRIKYTGRDVVTPQLLASLFGVNQVLVNRSISDGVSEGKTSAPALQVGKHALLMHVAPSPGLEVASAVITMNWTGLAAGYSGQGLVVDKIRMESLKSDRIEAHLAFDIKVASAALGYFMPSCVA